MKCFSAEIILSLPIVKCSLSDVIVPRCSSYGGGMSARQSLLLLLPARIVPCCVHSQNESFQLLEDVSIFACTTSCFPWKCSESKGWPSLICGAKAGLEFIPLRGEPCIKSYVSSVAHEHRESFSQ